MLYICSCQKRFSPRTEIDCSMIRWRCHNCFGLKSFVHDLFVFWICIRFVLCSTEKVNMFLTSCSSSNPTAALLRMKKKTNVERKLTGLSFNHFHIAHTSSANEQRYTIFVFFFTFVYQCKVKWFGRISIDKKQKQREQKMWNKYINYAWKDQCRWNYAEVFDFVLCCVAVAHFGSSFIIQLLLLVRFLIVMNAEQEFLSWDLKCYTVAHINDN